MTRVTAHRDGIDPVKGGVKFDVRFDGHDLERHVAQAVERFFKKIGKPSWTRWRCERTVISPEGKVLACCSYTVYSITKDAPTQKFYQPFAVTFTPPEM